MITALCHPLGSGESGSGFRVQEAESHPQLVQQANPVVPADYDAPIAEGELRVVVPLRDMPVVAAAGTIDSGDNAVPVALGEFAFNSELTLIKLAESEVADGNDLLTTLNRDNQESLAGEKPKAKDVKRETPTTGVRDLPVWSEEETDSFFSQMSQESEFLTF